MASQVPPKKATSFTFYTGFVNTAARPDFKANPTIASGDFKLSIDNTSGVVLAVNPAVITGATTIVRFNLSGSEMDGDVINVLCVDAAGGEWDDQLITIHTAAFLSDDISAGVSANLTAINSNAVGISANLAAINSNATALAVLKSDTVAIRSDSVAVRSDAVVIRSDTLFIKSDTVAIRASGADTTLQSAILTAVNSNAVGISANLTAINSNATALGILKSDSVVIRSDVLAIEDTVWDEVLTGSSHNVATSAGRRLRQIDQAFEVHDGTAQAGTSDTITLDAGASATSNIFRGDRIVIVEGVGAQEHGIVVSYNGTTKVATMAETWVIHPGSTSVSEIVPATVDLETWQHNVVTGDGDWAALSSDVTAVLADTGTTLPTQISANLTAINSNATAIGVVGSDTVVIRSDTLAVRALLDDARGEPGQGAPPVNPDAMTKIDYLYKNWRNRKTQTSDTFSLYADDATTVDQKATISDDATTGEKGEIATGA